VIYRFAKRRIRAAFLCPSTAITSRKKKFRRRAVNAGSFRIWRLGVVDREPMEPRGLPQRGETHMLPRFFVRLFSTPSHSSGRRRRGSRPAKAPAFRPRLEALDERTLPSVLPVSIAASGTDMGNHPSSIAYNSSGVYSEYQESLSSNGQFAVFTSTADNLVSGVSAKGNGNVYLRDLVNDTTSLVSISSDGTSGCNLGSTQPVITPDGRYVAFLSGATNLTSNSWNGRAQVLVRDMQQGQTYLVSLGYDGQPADQGVGNPSPSIAETNNGQLVIAYRSQATNLAINDTNVSNNQVFVTTFGLDAGGNIEYNTLATQLASADSTGNGGNGNSDDAILSADGSTLAFASTASNLPGETSDTADGHQHVQVFTYDVASGTLTQVSPAAPAGQTTDSYWLSSVSDNGQYLSYDYENHETGVVKVLAWNANTGTNTVVYTNQGVDYPVLNATVISGDGSTIAFRAGNGLGRAVIYAASNWQSGSPTLTQVSPDPSGSVWSSQEPSISDNGQVIVYQLTPWDWNVPSQVYVWNNGTTTEVSTASGGGDSNGIADTPAVSADGSTILFNSRATNLVDGVSVPPDSTTNVYAARLP
jgi:hypothetical protein